MPPLPGRPIETPEQAEDLAVSWMRTHGYPDATRTRAGADGGIDARARDALAQVKMHNSPVRVTALRELYGARGADVDKQLLFFARSATGYGKPARAYADEHAIALLTYDLAGSVWPVNHAARQIIRRTTGSPGGAAPAPAAPPTATATPAGMPAGAGCFLVLSVILAILGVKTLLPAAVGLLHLAGWAPAADMDPPSGQEALVILSLAGLWFLLAAGSWAIMRELKANHRRS